MASPRQAWANAFNGSADNSAVARRYSIEDIRPIDRDADPDTRRDSLEKIIEADIIPRLMLVHKSRAHPEYDLAECNYTPTGANITRLMTLVVGGDLNAASLFVQGLREQGLTLDSMFLELFAPVARRLGAAWESDELSFVDVTVGLSGLQQLLREFSPQAAHEGDAHVGAALLVPAPGEQHTFGLFVVMEFFRRAGWDVWGGPPMGTAELCRMVEKNWFTVVGFSLSREGLLDELASAIHDVRAASRNRFLTVMVGGRVFAERPELAARVGADATADDAKRAVMEAETLSGVAVGSLTRQV